MSVKSSAKTFIIDTNIILHYPTCIHQFEENNIVLHLEVIEEMDHPFLDSLSNGLSYLIEHFKRKRIYSHINLEKGERTESAEFASNVL